MSRYKAYPEYRDSEVEWVGPYPTDWKLTRVKFESYVKARVGWHGLKSDDFTDEGPYLVTGSDFNGPEIQWENCYHCDLLRYEQDPYIQLNEEDLLITKDGTIGKVALVRGLNDKATLNSGVFVVRPLKSNYTTKYYFWLLQSSAFDGFVDFNKTGSTIVHLYQDTFVNFKYAMPSFPEQQRIAGFLVHETAKIDALIEKQQRLIELLKEKRQAVISHAVTKGLNPKAPMGDSGVEWLGEVPAHWPLTKISHVGSVKNGCTPDKSNLSFWCDGTIPWLASACLNKEVIDEPSELISKRAFESCSLELIQAGSLLIGMVGQGKTRGASAILAIQSCINQNMAAITINEKIKIEFLYYVFQAMYSDLRELGRGGNQAALNCEIISSIRVPVPPVGEQEEIISSIQKLSYVMKRTNDLALQKIDLLQERRTALISAAVTGKIDVRDWQPAVAQEEAGIECGANLS